MKKLLIIGSLAVLVGIAAGCSSVKKIERSPMIGGLTGVEYLEKVIEQAPGWQNMSGKATLNLDLGSKGKTGVNATLRIRRGEVIRLSVAPLLGIEMARMDITPEGVLLLDRLNKRYVKVSFGELSELAHADLNFNILQSLFLNEMFLPGKAQLSSSDAVRFRISNEAGGYAQLEAKEGKMFTCSFRTTADRGLLEQTVIRMDGTPYGLNWQYSDFESVGQKLFPRHNLLTVEGVSQPISLDIQLSRLSDDSNWDAHTDIPKRYRQVELDEILKSLLKS